MIATGKKPETPAEGKSANAASRSAVTWGSIPWDHHRMIVGRLQLRIAKATREKKYRKAKSLQWLLTHSLSAKLLAVRRVMQNKGSKTPGVDGIIIKTPAEKLALALSMKRRGYKPSPLRRIYIPKAGNKNKKRPLSIPTIADRCWQALYLLALTPISEVTADLNSYGFRPHRSCADAIAQTFIALARKGCSQWILEGDIKGCFEHISHNWMSRNICLDKVIMNKWLKAGFIETGKLFPTTEGTPQGGIASPVMANMTLDGMANMLKRNFPGHGGLNFIRYADDFIVTGHSKELLEEEVRPAIRDFLQERGLELSEEKTKVTHITEGFDFLGQNVRKYPSQGKLKLLIKPSVKSIHSFLEGIRKIFRQARDITQTELIGILNPKIRGWANYHRSVVSKRTFGWIDNVIWHLTYQWAKRRHSNKGRNWILQKYYFCIGGVQHRFSGTEVREDGTPERHSLLLMSYTPIRRHVKILQPAHPFDAKYDEYFEKRISEKWRNNSKRHNIESIITMIQKEKCPCCREVLKISQNWCISLKRKASKGGEYKPGNADIVHRRCYKEWQSKRKA